MPPRASGTERPLVALSVGDPAGIGPEIARAALADEELRAVARIVALGPGALRPSGIPLVRRAAARLEPDAADLAVGWLDTGGDPASWRVGEARASSGRAALEALRAGHELALAGAVGALVTGPVSKRALHLAGERVEGQTELLARWCGVERCEMLAVAGALRVMLLSRHVPLRQALELVTPERVLDRLELLDASLRQLGIPEPRLALAGLNPHAGEGGLLGSEEEERLEPALARARAQGLRVAGPLSPDAVFLQAARGAFDGVLALYHDQAFIPVKLLSADGGVTVIAGLPYLRVSPVHGTAFDIAGRGTASPRNLIAAVRQAAAWVRAPGAAV
jgi:4-hydroxythreonine-4-phosphate dehydrogenase